MRLGDRASKADEAKLFSKNTSGNSIHLIDTDDMLCRLSEGHPRIPIHQRAVSAVEVSLGS